MNQAHTLAARGPLTPRCACRTLSLTTTDAEVSLGAGGYELVLGASSDLAVIGLGVTTAAKPDGTLTEGVAVIPSLGACDVVLDATTAVHARVLSGTATLYVVKKSEV